jgi:hypothetical protein
MRRTRPNPPPMYMALAKTGVNRRCMMYLLFFDDEVFAINFTHFTGQAALWLWVLILPAAETQKQVL